MIKVDNNQRVKLVSSLVEIQNQPSNIQELIKILLEKSESIDLNINEIYDLYHYTVNLEHQENQKREEILEILNPKLDVLFTDVPKFFKDAFESRELYLYCTNEDLFSFLKSNILLPIFHKDNGVIRGHDELERIIQNIKDNINQEIERINGFIINQPQLNYTKQEKQKLPFFKLLNMISPEIAQDEKYNYELLTLMINSKLESEGKTQSRFRAIQLKKNQDHRLGINWSSGLNHDKTDKNLFSHVHPACLSETEDYNTSNIKIRGENGVTKTLDYFLQGYLETIKERHRIEEITVDSCIPEFYSHVFLAEDRQDTNLHPGQKEHARLKLECKNPGYECNQYSNQNFFIRMAFESTEEPYIYKMTKEGRNEYHYSMIFYESSPRDGDYIYAADDTIEVTEITDPTYEQAMSGVCSRIVKQADQKSYLTMTMHLVPTGGRRSQISDLQGANRNRIVGYPQLVPRGVAGIGDEDNLRCDGQSSHSRIDIVSNPNAQDLPKGRLEANSFKIQSINFDCVSALVANKELYQISIKSEQPVKDCIQAMQDKINRMTGKENNLSNASRPSASLQSLCSTGPSSSLGGATERMCSPHISPPIPHSSRLSSTVNNFEHVHNTSPSTPYLRLSFRKFSTPINNSPNNLYPSLNNLQLQEENDESFIMVESPSSSLSSGVEVLEYCNKKSNVK